MRELDWLILRKLYEKRSISKAAEDLYVTQSALTKRVKTIEQEWGVEVVKRSSQGVTFTEDGRYLVKKAGIMLDFLGEIREHFSERHGVKELVRVGVPNSFARLHMPKLLKGYVDAYTRLQFKTFPNSSDMLIRQITDGTIDIAIVCGDYPFLGEKICLFEEELYIMAPMGTALEDVEHLPIIESYLNPMVKLLLNQWWKDHFGESLHAAHFVPYSDIAIEMVENGLGICFLFGSDWAFDRSRFQLIPIYNKEQEPVSRRVWMMLSDSCYRNQDIMDFISFTEEYYHINKIERK